MSTTPYDGINYSCVPLFITSTLLFKPYIKCSFVDGCRCEKLFRSDYDIVLSTAISSHSSTKKLSSDKITVLYSGIVA